MKKKATATFEVTIDTTIVTATGITGNTETIDITGTEIEKDFIKLLKKIQNHQLAAQITDALDIKKWEVFS